MRINAKKLTDEYDAVWILLWSDGGVDEPLAMIRDFEAESLATQIVLALDLKPPLNASEIPQKDASSEG